MSPRSLTKRQINPGVYLGSRSWRLTGEQLSWAIEQRKRGISGVKIAAEIGCSESALYAAFRAVGLGRSK